VSLTFSAIHLSALDGRAAVTSSCVVTGDCYRQIGCGFGALSLLDILNIIGEESGEYLGTLQSRRMV